VKEIGQERYSQSYLPTTQAHPRASPRCACGMQHGASGGGAIGELCLSTKPFTSSSSAQTYECRAGTAEYAAGQVRRRGEGAVVLTPSLYRPQAGE
jgi:hypothetical protein